ncbi:chemotaxis protein CheW [Agarilytica rhodophyticola]|uniref:chemotaxis protein CheW n=1 Tax=Agarilytica rhodophyticola TaxID=1737490 RepID=UPI000B3477FB|nr:chemotaxis protein CheW [Agarilytica rhodophyticola]
MSENPVATTTTSDKEIPCMLLPMKGHALLVPTTTVAEMSVVKALDDASGAPKWLMGLYSWRGIQVPVISIENLNGLGEAELNPDGRIAILNSAGASQQVPFIGIHTQGIPRMARIAEDDIAENEEGSRRPFDVMAVKVGMEEFYIPDITAIQMAYANVM